MASAGKRWIVTGTLLSAVALGVVLLGLRARTGDLALRIRIVRAVNEGGGAPLVMNDLAAFTWNSMMVLKPGTPRDVQARQASMPWYVRWLVGLESRDDVCVIAFKVGDNFRTHVVLKRKDVDCLPAARLEAYTSETAVFNVVKTDNQFSLAPANKPADVKAPGA